LGGTGYSAGIAGRIGVLFFGEFTATDAMNRPN
jgi:hypothetical protein